MTEVLIAGQPYPVAVDAKDGILWRVADIGQPVEETWQDWSGGMGETEHKPGTYLYSDGFDATRKGTLRLSPTIKSLVSSGLSTNHGYFFEATGAVTAPSFDAAVSGDTAGTAAASLTLSNLTVASGKQQRIIVVFISIAANVSAPFCSTVTFAGQRCIFIMGTNQTGISTEAWYLLNPPEGAGSTVITLKTGTRHIAAGAVSFYNVSQTSPFSVTNADASIGTPVTMDISGVGSTDTIIVGIGVGASLTVTAGTNETERWDNNDGANVTNAGYTQAGSDGSAITPTFTSNPWVAVGIALAAGTAQYYYWAEGQRIWKLEYDPDAGITEVVIESGTVDSATSTTLTDSGAFTGNTYGAAAGRNIVKLTGGTGSGQYRAIASHTNDVLTVAAWDTTPDATTTYSILASVDVASAVMGRPTYHTSKWYVPCGASVNGRRLDTVGATQDTWAAVTDLRSLHNSNYQKLTANNFAGATATNTIGTASAAPTGALTTLGTSVGDTSTTITDLIETQGFLYIAKEDGLYEMDSDGIFRPVLLGLSRANVDNQNGRTCEVFGDIILYPCSAGMIRYQIGSGPIQMGLEEIKGFRRVSNTGIVLPKDRQPVGAVRAGKYFYTVYNSVTKSLICQFRLREQGEPDGPEWLWHSLRDVSLVKGLGRDSQNRLWMKGADPDSGQRAFKVMELDKHGGTDTQYRRGAVSETYTIIFGEWTPNDGEQVQDRTFELELSGGWSAQTSLQPQVYRDDGNSAESVDSAIIAAGVTINNWTTGTTDTEYRSFTVLQVTTGATYTPLASDPMILRTRRKGRTPMFYRGVISANDTELERYGLTAEDARQNLYRHQNAGVLAINEPGPDGPKTTSFNAEIVAVKDVRYTTQQGIGYGIELLLRRHIQD